MGNDGGSIPTRRELVKQSSKPASVTALKEQLLEQLAHRWSQCPLSRTALEPPIVSDYTGELYNKESIIHFLLPDDNVINKSEAEDFVQGRVKSLKDVVDLQFQSDKDETTGERRWVCPMTMKALGASVPAVYLVPCGHVFSREAVETVGGGECGQCGESYVEERDVVPILPVGEVEKEAVKRRMEVLREIGLSHSLKKVKGEKKRKKGKEADEERERTEKKVKSNGIANGNGKVQENGVGIKNSETASVTQKVLVEEEAKKKRRLMTENENIQSLYTKKGSKNQKSDFMTRGFTIPDNARHT